jgi:outer membrane lipoprotein-sorting protein
MPGFLRMASSVLLASMVLSASPHWSSRFAAGDEDKSDASARLDVLLKAWEKANQNIRQVHYVMEWTTEDRVTKDKEIRRVEGFIKRPNLARVEVKEENGKLTHIFLLHDKTLEVYDFRNEQKGVWELPLGFPEDYLNKDWGMAFLARAFQWNRQLLCLEFPIGQIRQRFDIRLKNEDKHWAYIELIPRTKEDRSDLQKMEIVLDQRTHLVRQYRLLEVHGSWTIRDFQKVEINPSPPITLESISKGLPKGFKQLFIPFS